MRTLKTLTIASVAAAALIGVSPSAQAPNVARAKADRWTPPRGSDGHADLSGVWANNSVTPLERPREWAGKDHLTGAELDQLKRDISSVVDKEGDAIFQNVVEAALAKRKLGSYDPTTGNYNEFWMVEREIDNRTSLITDPPDGRLPALMPEAQKRRGARGAGAQQGRVNEGGPAGRADGPEDRPLTERCITFGSPRIGAGYDSYFQIVQSPSMVGILQETIHDVRMVPIDSKPHLPSAVHQWLGDSRGHWDGDTLVVETTNYSSKSVPFGATENLKTIERYTRASPDYINWEITFDDAQTWTRPWTMMVRLKKENHEIYEYACHEGNIAMTGILAGARAKEKASPGTTTTKTTTTKIPQ
jgi:hypothetical protein